MCRHFAETVRPATRPRLPQTYDKIGRPPDLRATIIDVTRVVHLISALGVIAVPVFGWFTQDWSGGTTLAVYWFETLAACLFILARIAVHQRWSPRRGHFRYNTPGADGGRRRTGRPLTSFMSGFGVVSLSFCAVHGLFLGVILFLLNHNKVGYLVEVDWQSVGFGCLSVLAFMTVDFVVDLFTLRRWPFRQLEQTASQALGRVMVVHLTLLIGFIAIAVTDSPRAFFGVFVVLKMLAALSTALPQWQPAKPPRWMSRAMDKVPSAHPAKKFDEFWEEERTEERQRLEANERPWVDEPR